MARDLRPARPERFFSTVNPTVFVASAIIIVGFVLFGVVVPETAGRVFGEIQGFITEYLGWVYLLAVTGFLGFLVWLLFSRYGSIRLGEPDARPQFGKAAWF
ncbi:MAG: BCCT family transporter, partial [Halospina sp.]